METGDRDKMAASIRILRSIVWNEGFENKENNPFMEIMTSREYVRIYTKILKDSNSIASLKLKFELVWLLINVTALKIFTKDNLVVMMEEGVVEQLIKMISLDYEEDNSAKMFVWYYWVWIIKHFFLTINYDHKLIIELGIIPKIASIFTNWKYLFWKRVEKSFNKFTDRFFELLYLIVKNVNRDHFEQLYELAETIGRLKLYVKDTKDSKQYKYKNKVSLIYYKKYK